MRTTVSAGDAAAAGLLFRLLTAQDPDRTLELAMRAAGRRLAGALITTDAVREGRSHGDHGGVVLPGNSTVEHVTVDVPAPGPGQVLVQMKASSICRKRHPRDHREHAGTGAEAYQGVIAGHEPCGQVVAVGSAMKAARGRRQGRDLSHCGL